MVIRTVEQGILPSGLTVTAAADVIPGNPRSTRPLDQKRFGVGEALTLRPVRLAPGVNVQWSIRSGNGVLTPGLNGSATFTIGDVVATTSMVLELKTTAVPARLVALVGFDVVPPDGVAMFFIRAQHRRGGEWDYRPNGGFFGHPVIKPIDIHFGAIEFRETAGPNSWVCTGECARDPWYVRQASAVVDVTTHQGHDARQGRVTRRENVHAGEGVRHFDNANMENWCQSATSAWTVVGTVLTGITDGVFSGFSLAHDAASAARFFNDNHNDLVEIGAGQLKIPVHYRLRGDRSPIGRRFGEWTHKHSVKRGGAIIVEKGGVVRRFLRTDPAMA